MGRKALLTVVYWLTLSQTYGAPSKDVKHSSITQDNVSAASARLYRNVPLGVYASAAPHGAYSFHLPAFIAAPKTAASQSVPVKQPLNPNSYLKDSYGNSFLASPQMQMLAYKTAFPQQYASLQTKLPEHLAQPLVAASPNFQFQQSSPQVFFGAPYRVPALQGPSPTPLHHFPTFGQLYGGEQVRSLAPSSSQNHNYGNTHEQFSNLKKEPHFEQIQEKHRNQDEPKFQRSQLINHAPQTEVKFQRIQEIPQVVYGEQKFERLKEVPSTVGTHHTFERIQDTPKIHQEANPQATHNLNAQIQAAPLKQTTVTYVDANGKKSVVQLETKPALPLLDLTLLEPLTFANPLVPQVQHFLPRIHQATYQKLPQANIPEVKNYQKEFVVSKTMSYDSDDINGKAKEVTKKKQKKPTHSRKHGKKNDAPKTTVTYEHLDDAPEITYEISNSPNHKETIKEKSVSYNKKTESDPVHYSYGSKSQKEPVTYSFSRTSKEPAHQVHYNGNGPSHLVYNFKPEEQTKEEIIHNSSPHDNDDDRRESSNESDGDDGPSYHNSAEQYNERPKSSEVREKPTHQEQIHQHQSQREPQNDVHHNQQHYSAPLQYNGDVELQPVTKEFEEDIRLLTPAPNAQIMVDPNQHVQHEQPTAQPHSHSTHHGDEHSHAPQHPNSYDREEDSYAPQGHSHSTHHHTSPTPQHQEHYSNPHSHSEANEGPATHVHEKSKRIIVQEESPDERHILTEQMKAEMIKQEENNEEDFEKAYQASAFGFPGYSGKLAADAEKDIFDPETYGAPPEHIEFNVENTPFQQYQEEGDDYPKATRSNYKDSRDKMKENYYSDYSVSKPEGLLDRYQNKLGYYKLYKQQKPDYLSQDDEDDEKKSNKQSAKYTAAPSYFYGPSEEKSSKKLAKLTAAPLYHYGPSDEKSKSYYGHSKPTQQLSEYDYSKATPRDNSAFASLPYKSYRTKTSFVEPQFQYGFEPILIPKLDSELAAMATNHSPESEKQGTRKKMYKENWYIKKTSTSAGAPAS